MHIDSIKHLNRWHAVHRNSQWLADRAKNWNQREKMKKKAIYFLSLSLYISISFCSDKYFALMLFCFASVPCHRPLCVFIFVAWFSSFYFELLLLLLFFAHVGNIHVSRKWLLSRLSLFISFNIYYCSFSTIECTSRICMYQHCHPRLNCFLLLLFSSLAFFSAESKQSGKCVRWYIYSYRNAICFVLLTWQLV